MSLARQSHNPMPEAYRIPRRSRPSFFRMGVDVISFALMYFVALTTFFPLETYLAGGDGEVALPLPLNSLTMVFSTVFAIFLCILAARSGKKIQHPYLLYFYVVIAFASVSWSDDVRTTLLRAPRLAMLVALAVAFASYYDF